MSAFRILAAVLGLVILAAIAVSVYAVRSTPAITGDGGQVIQPDPVPRDPDEILDGHPWSEQY